jgi:hypothetical protein
MYIDEYKTYSRTPKTLGALPLYQRMLAGCVCVCVCCMYACMYICHARTYIWFGARPPTVEPQRPLVHRLCIRRRWLGACVCVCVVCMHVCIYVMQEHIYGSVQDHLLWNPKTLGALPLYQRMLAGCVCVCVCVLYACMYVYMTCKNM